MDYGFPEAVSVLQLGHLWLWFNILYVLIVCLAIYMYFYI